MSTLNSTVFYNTPQQRVKRVIKTVTRTFDENENLIEEREETDTEYEYTSGYTHTNNPIPTVTPTYPSFPQYPYIIS